MKKALLFLVLINISFSIYGQLTINHLNTNITLLSEESINTAKSTLHIAYAHTSHGSQLTEGMSGLVAFANGGGKGLALPENIFAFNTGGVDGALDLEDHYGDMGDVGYYPDWYNHTINFLGEVDPNTGRGTAKPEVNVMMWSWCGQAANYSEQDMFDQYLNPMSQLESVYYNVKFVYMTCHLNGSGFEGNLHLRNEQIRNFCNANNKTLYDFADIETYDPDGVYYGELYPTDGCNYDASGDGYTSQTGDPAIPEYESGDRNWAMDWQDSHVLGVDWYECGSAHSQPLNANQKAYAAWALFVGIADLINNGGVPDDLEVSDTIVGNGESACFNARETITVAVNGENVAFEDGSSVNLISGGNIIFLPGFRAYEGSNVTAGITADGIFCGDGLKSTVISNDNSISIQNEKDAVSSEIIGNDFYKVYPNPNNGNFVIKIKNPDKMKSLELYSSLGQKILGIKEFFEEITEVNLTGIRPGIYFIKARGEKEFPVQKLIIK